MNFPLLRILDANANRAREGLRTTEDYARFVLNDGELSGQIKALRHELRANLERLLRDAIAFRDTPADVGTTIKTSAELKRSDVADIVIAAGKRVGEALRAIEETCKTLDPAVATSIERMRYRFYTIEKTLLATLRPANDRLAEAKLYVLITESSCGGRDWLTIAEVAIVGGAQILQLREKDLEGGELLRRAKQLVALCRKHGVISIINDRVDIAALADADGVHLGQGDLPATEARKLLGRDKIIGVSTHELIHATQAVRDGADYIGVGPIFPSSTKPRNFISGLDYARQIVEARLSVPAFAIAGITLENLPQLQATGLNRIAITAACIGASDVTTAARQFRSQLEPTPEISR